MEALLARSNANDEFLDLMLLTTGEREGWEGGEARGREGGREKERERERAQARVCNVGDGGAGGVTAAKSRLPIPDPNPKIQTGYLRQVDEEPPWLCLPLPWPLHGLRHQTISARPLGYAEVGACVPATEQVLEGAWGVCALLCVCVLVRQVGAGRARSWMDSKVRVRLKTE
jgi:hypothetical protein